MDDFKKRNVNIIHLQETHLIASDLSTLKKFWNCKFLIAGENKNSLGVITVINNNFEYKLHSVQKDSGGRFILCDIELPGIVRFLMLNIYGHNQDKPALLRNILEKLEDKMIRNWILCGDWNFVLDQNMDTYNYIQNNNPNSKLYFETFMEKHNLIDIWRKANPSKKNYTWFRTNPTKAARLDYFIISPTLLDIYADSFILFKYRSDHCKIGLTLHLDKNLKGKGLWKLNAELLKNDELIQKIEEGIQLMVEIHACTPYNPEFVKKYDNNKISFMVPIDTFWEVLLTHLRGIFISFAARKKRERCNREDKLVKEIQSLDELFILDMTDITLENNLNEKKRELEILRDIKLKGAFVRSRVKEYNLGEKPNKHFLNLENYNFVSKNIKELLLDDDKKLFKPTDILEEMRRFYQSLYSSKEIKPLDESNLAGFPKHFNTLNEHEKAALDADITECELKTQVFKSGLNKSPGPDGFTNEFYRILWYKIKTLLLELMQHFFEYKNISQNHLMGIITCIPKGDKLRNKLKNWRPITLLNCIYKFYSGIWANRIKKNLPKLIGKNQTGFVQNRFIGENNRLTFDILKESEHEKLNGLLILVDFEKAFDSISWDFITKILNLFNFSDQTIQVIKSLQKNSISKILQNGHCSDIINLERGCRQGDPISPYIFVLSVELLGTVFRKHSQLQGYKIGNREHRVSQFADDTTLFITRSERNLRLCMDILGEFYLVSGLKINVDKTKVVKFGGNRDSRDILCPDLNLIWTNKFTSLGIEYDVSDLDNITKLNLDPKIKDIDNLTKIWQIRNLTIIGKITIIKSLFISKIIHILLSLPSPNDFIFDEIESIFQKFLWKGKPPKFRNQLIEKQISEGGLQYPNIRAIDATMKISWFKRIYISDADWVSFPYMYNMDKIYMYGDIYLKKLSLSIKNPFWKDTVKSLLKMFEKPIFISQESILATPIWYNSEIINEKIDSWDKKGIKTIGDIIDIHGNILSRQTIEKVWNINCNFLFYLRLKKKIQNSMFQYKVHNSYKRPQLSHVLYRIDMGNGNNKNVYSNIIGRNTNNVCIIKDKWSESFNDDILLNTVQTSFTNTRKFSPTVYQYYNQFKLIHRRTVNNKLLKKMGIIEDDKCLYCKDHLETIEHIYIFCNNTIRIWNETISWVRNIYDPHFTISDQEKIFGYSSTDPIGQIIVISVKDVIYQKRKSGTRMMMADVKRCLLKNLNILKSRIMSQTNQIQFTDSWEIFITDLRNDIHTKNSWYIF